MIARVAVLGAGTMGSRIAAHLANAGARVILLDIEAQAAARAVAGLKAAKPAAFFEWEASQFIETGSFSADLARLSECQWVIEAVTEDLPIKREVIRKIAEFVRPNTPVSTNTSGLSVAAIADGLPESFRRAWFGVHFFNPPRHMRLVEVIPTEATDQQLMDEVAGFITERLGKTVVVARDTPNFIANRIGIFTLLNVVRLMQELDLTVEEVDALTGSVIGWPSSATFRLMDMIGLDVISKLAGNSDVAFPQFMTSMVARGWLGNKASQGFYRRSGEPAVLNWKTLEYDAMGTVELPLLMQARNLRSLPERLRFLLEADLNDKAGRFYSQLLPDVWEYAAHRLPEIAEDIADIDVAMQAGFGWELGPFAMCDAAGLGEQKWYTAANSKPSSPIAAIRHSGGVVNGNGSVSLLDLGDGIGCLELHTKMNAIDNDALSFVIGTLAPQSPSVTRFRAFVIYNESANFSVGANLKHILTAIEAKNWSEISRFIRAFQQMTQSIKFYPRPVVAAPFGLCLGGGAEVALHAAARQAHAETSMGLVEASVGLIPAGGGCKEMILRATEGRIGWEQMFYALVTAPRSSSAAEAKRMGLLDPTDAVTMNRDLLLRDAKRVARHMAEQDYQAPKPVETIGRPGEVEQTQFRSMMDELRRSQTITDYDAKIAGKLAQLISNGGSEQQLLDAELEIFLSLCGEQKTAERIAFTLKTGKPLRN